MEEALRAKREEDQKEVGEGISPNQTVLTLQGEVGNKIFTVLLCNLHFNHRENTASGL